MTTSLTLKSLLSCLREGGDDYITNPKKFLIQRRYLGLRFDEQQSVENPTSGVISY